MTIFVEFVGIQLSQQVMWHIWYIIGGQTTDCLGIIYVPVVAEYKNDVWSNAGELLKGRYAHGSIVNGLETMVIGYVSRGS